MAKSRQLIREARATYQNLSTVWMDSTDLARSWKAHELSLKANRRLERRKTKRLINIAKNAR